MTTLYENIEKIENAVKHIAMKKYKNDEEKRNKMFHAALLFQDYRLTLTPEEASEIII